MPVEGVHFPVDTDMDEIKKLQDARVQLGMKHQGFDENIYGDLDDRENYVSSLPTDVEDTFDGDDDEFTAARPMRQSTSMITSDGNSSNDTVNFATREQNGSGLVDTRISNRESEVCYYVPH